MSIYKLLHGESIVSVAPCHGPHANAPDGRPQDETQARRLQREVPTEAETERYFAARDTGATEADALQISVGTPVGPPSTPLPRRVAYNGHLLNDAESRHYFAARDAGLDHEAAARAAQKEAPAATAKPLYRGPLPANLPKRVAINGKLLSVEETEQYFREKLIQNPPGDH